MTNHWKDIPEKQRFWVSVIAIVAALFLAGWRFGTFIEIPARVQALEEKMEQVQSTQDLMLRGIERTNCKLDLILEGRPEKRCP